MSAGAIANSVDFQHERRVTTALTRGFVPQSLPEVAGFEVGLAYEPAASQSVGGDVYGAWPLPSGEIAMLVGDVAGKGVEKAALRQWCASSSRPGPGTWPTPPRCWSRPTP